eukprot:337843-Chlamydomonas_euryale.AAC.2
MGLGSSPPPSLYLYASDVIDDVLSAMRDLSPHVLVVDSLQTMRMRDVAGSPGCPTQVRALVCAMEKAKRGGDAHGMCARARGGWRKGKGAEQTWLRASRRVPA